MDLDLSAGDESLVPTEEELEDRRGTNLLGLLGRLGPPGR
jgi:hypothetical protein